MTATQEVRVCLDIGCNRHRVGIGLPTGELLEEFDIQHSPSDIRMLFEKVSAYSKQYDCSAVFAMEAYNGYARPIDQMVLSNEYKLLNVNNHKLAQYKKVFPGAAKSDAIDTRKMFELFTLCDHLPMSKQVLQKVPAPATSNQELKCLTRRRRMLVEEKVSILCRLQANLQACAPGLLSMTKRCDNTWFLSFLCVNSDLTKLAKLQPSCLLKIRGVDKRYIDAIKAWQKDALFSNEVSWTGEMIVSDAKRILALKSDIKLLEERLAELLLQSDIGKRLNTIVGFGTVCAAELAGEIGTITRFSSESSLALYLGMAVLDNSSGNYKGTKNSRHVNHRAKMAMMRAVARHINYVDESKKYYEKKRAEGKRHNQAVRSLGRHMTRVIWSMLKNQRDYKTDSKGDTIS